MDPTGPIRSMALKGSVVLELNSKAHRDLVSILRARRMELRLSQAQLSKRCKEHGSFVSKIEALQRGVYINELPTLAKALELTEQQLMKRWWAYRDAS